MKTNFIRNFISFTLAFALIFSLAPYITISAADDTDYYTPYYIDSAADDFEINADGVLTKYNGAGGDVVIPDGGYFDWV